jgi:hypothetical protein
MISHIALLLFIGSLMISTLGQFSNKRLFAFRELEYPHDAELIFRFVLSIIEEYQYRDKFFSISFDNASNCNVAIRLLTNTLKPIMDGAFFHTKCACHILNLIVKAGMEVDPIRNLIGTTRLRHGTPDTACLIRIVPPSIIFGHDTTRHEKK